MVERCIAVTTYKLAAGITDALGRLMQIDMSETELALMRISLVARMELLLTKALGDLKLRNSTYKFLRADLKTTAARGQAPSLIVANLFL